MSLNVKMIIYIADLIPVNGINKGLDSLWVSIETKRVLIDKSIEDSVAVMAAV